MVEFRMWKDIRARPRAIPGQRAVDCLTLLSYGKGEGVRMTRIQAEPEMLAKHQSKDA